MNRSTSLFSQVLLRLVPAALLALGAGFLTGAAAFAQGGSSPTFTRIAVAAGSDVGTFTALQPDGGILSDGAKRRFLPDGREDSGYQLNLGEAVSVSNVHVASGGQLYVSATRFNGGFELVQCNVDGSLARRLFTANQAFTDFLLQPDGRILVWSTGVIDGLNRRGIARLNADGSLDTSFDAGLGPNFQISSVALQDDGRIVVGGYFTSFDNITALGLVRLNASGVVDSSFSYTTGGAITALTLLANGQLFAWSATEHRLLLVNANGSLAQIVGQTSGGSDQIYAMARQPDGKVLIAGGFTSFGGHAAASFARLNADGSFDPTFDAGSAMANLSATTIMSLAVQADGKIFFNAPRGLVRLRSDGSPDVAFAPGSPVAGQVLDLARTSTGKLFVTGLFLSINGSRREGLALLNADGTVDPSFVPAAGIRWTPRVPANTAVTVGRLAVLPDDSVLVAGTIDGVGGVGQAGIVHFFADGTLDTGFNPTLSTSGKIYSVCVLPDGHRVIGGSFSSVAGTARSNLAAFTAGGALDPAFAASGPNGTVMQLQPRAAGGLYLAGTFTAIAGVRANSVAALDASGAFDPGFTAAGVIPSGTAVQALQPLPDGKLVVATASSLVRLQPSGALDLTYAAPNLVGANYSGFMVTALAAQPDGRLVAGLTETVVFPRTFPSLTQSTPFLVRFDTGGRADATFVTNSWRLDAPVAALSFAADGSLGVGGTFTRFGDLTVSGLVLINRATDSVTDLPVILTGPDSVTAAVGASVTFSVTAQGAGLRYQWQFNGLNLNGATGSSLTVNNLSTGDAGNYSVAVSNSAGTVFSAPATLTLPFARLVNLSARALVGTGNNVLIAGFISRGTGNKQLAVRAVGPGLGAYGLTGLLPNPQLNVVNTAGASQASAGAWGGGAALSALFDRVGGFPLAPNSVDSGLAATLAAGAYTAIVRDTGSGTGVALAELYDADTTLAPVQLVNLSARAFVGTGDNVLIAGFIIAGNQSKTVLLRGVGPGLTAYGLSGILAQPRLTLFDVSGAKLAENAGWASDPAIAQAAAHTGAFALAPGSNDAALLVTLAPGTYTVQVSGTAGGTGLGLVEIYDADP